LTPTKAVDVLCESTNLSPLARFVDTGFFRRIDMGFFQLCKSPYEKSFSYDWSLVALPCAR
jgi:hypothetical protein